MENTERKQRRGFAAMDPATQRRIASAGGRASHAKGTGHEWTKFEASLAGRKGGLNSRGGRGKLPKPEAVVPSANDLPPVVEPRRVRNP